MNTMLKRSALVAFLLFAGAGLKANPVDTLSSGSPSPVADEVTVYSEELVLFSENRLPLDKELYFQHVSELEFAIPMDFNDEVARFIHYFGTAWQPKLKKVITQSEYYFPVYEAILDKNNLPLELKYLSVIESALNPMATSRSGAAGLWQFMPFTGKIYDLEINSYLDERRDLEKSTAAACRYFSDMYRSYGDWLLVLASYNCGPGNVNKAIRKSGGKRTFWEIYPYLPSETQNYVPSFLAVAYLMNFYEHYGITPAPPEFSKPELTRVVCTQNENLEVICQVLEMDEQEFKTYNPFIKTTKIPSTVQSYEIRLPEDYAYTYLEKQNEIRTLSAQVKPQVVEQIYVVRKGDSLLSIAGKYDCSITELKGWNGLSSNVIHPGQKLKILL